LPVYTLVSGKEPDGAVHHYLVDAGFAADKWIHRFGFYHWEAPEAVLAKVGVAPADIEKVFLTHRLRFVRDGEEIVPGSSAT
jgi:hypothetical protein